MFVVLVVSVLSVLVFLINKKESEETKLHEDYCEKNGLNKKEVEIFCQIIGCGTDDFRNSEGLKAQYKTWLEGGSNSFIQTAISKAKKEAKKAQDDASTASMLTTAAIASFISASNNS